MPRPRHPTDLPKPKPARRAASLGLCMLAACATACFPSFPEDCFETDTCDEGNGGSGKNESVEEVLADLGIVQTSEPRVDEDGDPLPEDYAPLGSRRTINPFSEIVFFGAQLDDGGVGRMPLLDVIPGANNTFSWSRPNDPPLESTPWMDARRDAVEGDFDGDGQDEVAVVYQQTNEPVRLVIMDGPPDYGFGESLVLDTNTWSDVFVESGDFDGDGRVDLVVGLVGDGDVLLTTFANRSDGFRVDGTPRVIERPGMGAMQLVLKSGNLDHDAAQELAVVANFRDESARYYVYDDALRDHALVRSDLTAIRTDTAVVTAVVADVDLGDVDGDGVDELILGGLNRAGTVRQDAVDYLIEVMDDLDRDLVRLAGLQVASGANRLQPTSSGASHRLSFVHVLAADVDGDGAKEIVANQLLFEDLRQSPGALTPLDLGDGPVEIPIEDLLTDGDAGDDYNFSWRSSDMAAGDVTSDKRENVVLYAQRLTVFGEGQELQVWGVDGIDGWKDMLSIETTFDNPLNSPGGIRPRILLADTEVDNESMALEYSQGSYRYVFTEPVILAALAAAPCSTELGQDVGSSCRTAFGKAVSETQERENSWSIVAGASVGFEASIPFVGGVEAIANTRSTVRSTTTDTYSLQTSVLRETGPLEDSVIFTTVPLDIYTYTVLSHPNPELIGQNIEIRLPREPITVMVQTDVYNRAIEEDGLAIDDDIFGHTPGDPSTYPRRSDKNALLSRYQGLESDEVDVGQGSGQTIVSITDFSSTTMGVAYDFEATLDVKTTGGGVVAGFTVGGGAGTALRITRGEETIYQGSVGNLSEEFFPRETYAWGLFSYIYSDPRSGQTFEVLDYWVEQP